MSPVPASLWDNISPPGAVEGDQEGRLEFTGYRWGLVLQDGNIEILADQFHLTDQDEPVIGDGSTLLCFLTRALSAQFESDLEALKSLDVAITDNPEMESSFSETVVKLRNNYDALYKMIYCMLYGKAANNAVKTILIVSSLEERKTVDRFVEKVTELFDFSNIWTFISSYPVAVDKIAEDVSILTGIPIPRIEG